MLYFTSSPSNSVSASNTRRTSGGASSVRLMRKKSVVARMHLSSSSVHWSRLFPFRNENASFGSPSDVDSIVDAGILKSPVVDDPHLFVCGQRTLTENPDEVFHPFFGQMLRRFVPHFKVPLDARELLDEVERPEGTCEAKTLTFSPTETFPSYGRFYTWRLDEDKELVLESAGFRLIFDVDGNLPSAHAERFQGRVVCHLKL